MPEKDWISSYFAPLARSSGAAGLMDDVAEMTPSGDAPVVVTVDAMVEGIHFRADDPLASVARKLVRVNVSDIYSAGALPTEALLTLGWPEQRPEAELADFATAFGHELAVHGIQLLGGDTVKAPAGLFLSLTLTGVCQGARPVRRNGAKPGQDVWLTGQIGAACLGFDALGRGDKDDRWVYAYQEPRLPYADIATLVARYASAAMDVSDGLLGDAAQMAKASGCGIEINLENISVAGNSRDLSEILRLTTWGDDYQILFSAEKNKRDEILSFASASVMDIGVVGEMASDCGLKAIWRGEAVNLPETLGFEHGW
ncbi:thiamine-phosphate kinase [Hyphomonas pacifica]|uniref:Thiamine-monophosphate kinase n=1 Tax=Hyphomonas pacifica TaxID=1280941 RepID=A0A062TUE5_9PROT|nr:thiamine-phosphate kinase [Hyphomonas pacifica]KCZ51606.1 hypothetical protein HY2_01240 [Hyphomonas pacifica]RAN34275.1 hypothetical protein HY3_01325 [Hyphomonas pacifica]